MLEEGLAADELRAPRSRRSRGRRAAAGVEIVITATRRSSSAATPTGCTSARPGSARDPRARLSPSALRPGDRILLSGSIGEHGTAIMLARGEFELDARSSPTPLAVAGGRRAARGRRPDLRCLRDATRGGVASVLNELARASSVAMIVREGAFPVSPRSPGGRDPRNRPDVRGQRGQAGRVRRAGGADAALAALRSVPGCEQAAEIGEVRTEPPGMVLVRRASAAGG
jgi:hydrogenase expression/formation protein HypE